MLRTTQWRGPRLPTHLVSRLKPQIPQQLGSKPAQGAAKAATVPSATTRGQQVTVCIACWLMPVSQTWAPLGWFSAQGGRPRAARTEPRLLRREGDTGIERAP